MCWFSTRPFFEIANTAMCFYSSFSKTTVSRFNSKSLAWKRSHVHTEQDIFSLRPSRGRPGCTLDLSTREPEAPVLLERTQIALGNTVHDSRLLLVNLCTRIKKNAPVSECDSSQQHLRQPRDYCMLSFNTVVPCSPLSSYFFSSPVLSAITLFLERPVCQVISAVLDPTGPPCASQLTKTH